MDERAWMLKALETFKRKIIAANVSRRKEVGLGLEMGSK